MTLNKSVRNNEDVVDMDLKDSERIKKLYRQIQRQVQSRQESKMNSARWRRERARSVCSGLIREREGDSRKKDDKRSHSQSVFPPCSITPDEDTDFVNNDMPSYSGTMLSKMLEEADKRKKLRSGERNRKRAKMLLTCGAMTLLVILVTLAMASYPTIQRVFGG